MSWIDRLIQVEDKMVADAVARERGRVLDEVWNALDKAYADSDPQGPTRKGIGIAASIVATMRRTSGVEVPATGPDLSGKAAVERLCGPRRIPLPTLRAASCFSSCANAKNQPCAAECVARGVRACVPGQVQEGG